MFVDNPILNENTYMFYIYLDKKHINQSLIIQKVTKCSWLSVDRCDQMFVDNWPKISDPFGAISSFPHPQFDEIYALEE